jgi:hypothetical protein
MSHDHCDVAGNMQTKVGWKNEKGISAFNRALSL